MTFAVILIILRVMEPFDLKCWPEFRSAIQERELDSSVIDQIAIDSRRIDSPKALFIALPGSRHDGHQFVRQAAEAGARFALVKKDWPAPPDLSETLFLLRVEDPLHALQEIASLYRLQMPAKFIAIAGSYGKTMVKDLLQTLISTTMPVAASPESFNSQIGAALSIFTVQKDDRWALIEVGISKKGEMERLAKMIKPDHMILTHIGKKHLATLGDLKTVAAEMIKIGQYIPKEHWTLLPETPLLHPHTSKMKAAANIWNERSFLLPHAFALSTENVARMPYRLDFPDGTQYLSQATFGFYYFLDLINIAVKAAWLMGISSNEIRNTLESYRAEPMRTEIWRSPMGATFINDSYCSDPQSVSRALRHLDLTPAFGKKIFIFEGMREKKDHIDTDYRHIGDEISKAKVNLLFLVGEYSYENLKARVVRDSPEIAIHTAATHQEALEMMRPMVQQNDIILIKGAHKAPLDLVTQTFNDSICTNQCLINLAAIEANIATMRKKLTSHRRIMVMVKAAGYGTDEIRMAKFLEGCGIDILGVSYVDEGVALKRAGVNQEVFVINAATYEAAKVVKWNLSVGVSEKGLITALAYEANRFQKKIKLHLHLDTGMSRFGCRPEDALELAQYIKFFPELSLEGIMTHFAAADDPSSDPFTLSQVQEFEKVIQQLKSAGINVPWVHAANSSAVMRFDFPQFNMVRIGLAVYGLYPSEATKQAMELRLAISLVSRIVGINTCRAGETISYGRSYVVQREQQRIAVLPIGYFDGIHRNYSGKGAVLIRGQKAPMVGKICMDFMMVDVTDIPNATIGDPVLIFGEDEHGHFLSPEELALSGDSIIYELITCMGPRIQRIFIHEEAYQKR